MARRSIVNTNAIEPTTARRRYDNRVRRAQVANTRERILAAGSDLAHRAKRWDWRNLTIAVIAKQAGVSERTVYRHFPTERVLHEALMRRLEQDAGISYESLQIGDLTEASSRLFASLPSFAVPPTLVARDPTFAASDIRRRESLVRAVSELTADWSESERQKAAAIIDLMWTPLSYERLVANWGLDATQASDAVSWALDLLIKAIRAGTRP